VKDTERETPTEKESERASERESEREREKERERESERERERERERASERASERERAREKERQGGRERARESESERERGRERASEFIRHAGLIARQYSTRSPPTPRPLPPRNPALSRMPSTSHAQHPSEQSRHTHTHTTHKHQTHAFNSLTLSSSFRAPDNNSRNSNKRCHHPEIRNRGGLLGKNAFNLPLRIEAEVAP
jgi:hypothetical protein